MERFYRTNVVQAVRTETGTLSMCLYCLQLYWIGRCICVCVCVCMLIMKLFPGLKITEDTEKLDNIPYKDGEATVIEASPTSSQCCQNKNTKKT